MASGGGYRSVETKQDPDEEAAPAVVHGAKPSWRPAWSVGFCLGCALVLVVIGLKLTREPHPQEVRPEESSQKIALGAKRWAIAGIGRIAYDFAAMLISHGGRLEAVAAGSLPDADERAAAFSQHFGIPRHYGSYEALAADPDVDVVYVAVTNQLHESLSLLLLKSGKHVLVEKPTAVSTVQAVAMMREARERNLLLATNFWTMAFPAVRWALDLVEAGALGDVLAVRGDMAFEAVYDLQDRFLSPKLGGGAMLDMGCYIVHLFVQIAAADVARRSVSRLPTRPAEAYTFTLEDLRRPFEMLLLGHHNESSFDEALAGVRVAATGQLDRRRDARAGLDSPDQEPVDVEASASIDLAGVRLLLGTSLQRASPFTLEALGAHGIVHLDEPANCPESAYADIYRDANLPDVHVVRPCCGQPQLDHLEVHHPLDRYPPRWSPEMYPNGMGFVYVAHSVEACLSQTPPCLELDEIPAWTQVATQLIVDTVIRQIRQNGDLF